ncbi:Hypothetical predicted protein [Octopus vulgaris]|uniref:Uncharacterized protein n=1 Tax=Octopus vulgaris TaxID=6645 RepID=A0AA36F632_OCTVU|nr:Hypothetical predicted protein [Octopus vulgaris]
MHKETKEVVCQTGLTLERLAKLCKLAKEFKEESQEWDDDMLEISNTAMKNHDGYHTTIKKHDEENRTAFLKDMKRIGTVIITSPGVQPSAPFTSLCLDIPV